MRFSKESPIPNSPRIEAALPDAALPGGEIEIRGTQLGSVRSRLPVAMLDGVVAPVLLSRANRMIVRIPEDVQTGRLEIRQNGQSSNTIRLKIARLITGNLHPVGNPAVDAEGNIYSTDSGPRGQKTAVSVYRITSTGEMQPFVSGITNATGLAIDAQGYLYVSSRLDGTVHRVSPGGASSVYAEGMGIATGIAFDSAGNLYVGDRSGTIFKIARTGRFSYLPPWSPVSPLTISLLAWMERCLLPLPAPPAMTRSMPSIRPAWCGFITGDLAAPRDWHSTLPATCMSLLLSTAPAALSALRRREKPPWFSLVLVLLVSLSFPAAMRSWPPMARSMMYRWASKACACSRGSK